MSVMTITMVGSDLLEVEHDNGFIETITRDEWQARLTGTDTAQAVAIERNMTATWLDKLGDDEMWADIATRYHLAAEAIRNGEHHKEEA